MKAVAFDYADPTTVTETLDLLQRHDDTVLLAGGQSLLPYLHFRQARPAHVIDLNAVAGLAGIEPTDHGQVTVGAMTRQRALAESELIARDCPVALDALRHIGHVATRSRGTLGGSLCNLDPSAELHGVSMLHDAVLRVRRAGRARDIDVLDWAGTYMTPAIAHDELLESITWRAWPPGHGHAFVEFSKRHHDYAVVGAGALVTVDADLRIDRAAVVVLGVGVAAQRLPAAEAMLRGQPGSPALFRQAAQEVDTLEPFPDEFAAQGYPRRFVTAGFRRHLGLVLVRRALERAWSMAVDIKAADDEEQA